MPIGLVIVTLLYLIFMNNSSLSYGLCIHYDTSNQARTKMEASRTAAHLLLPPPPKLKTHYRQDITCILGFVLHLKSATQISYIRILKNNIKNLGSWK